MDANYYRELETRLTKVLEATRSQISEDDIVQIKEFLDVGEYRLAYDGITEALRARSIPEAIKNDLAMIAKMMGIA